MNDLTMLVALGTDDVAGLVELASSVPEGHRRVVVVTSSRQWEPLRQAGLRWEYLLDRQAWERLDHDRPWVDYARRRLQGVMAAWSPASVLQLAAESLPPELAVALLPAAAAAPAPPAERKQSKDLARLHSRMGRLEARQQELAKEHERLALAQAVDALVARSLPPGERAAVISRGDPLLTSQETLSHFPQEPGGAWAGFYPSNGREAVAHLQAVMARGIRYLLVPPPATWWLDHYPELAERLRQGGTIAGYGAGGTLFCLDEHASG